MAENHKQGDSLDYLGVIPLDYVDGYFVGWTLSGMIRSYPSYTLIDSLDIAWVDPTVTRSFTVRKINTQSWPVGAAVMDVQFTRTSDGYVKSTDTIQFNILHDVTYT